MHVIFLYR